MTPDKYIPLHEDPVYIENAIYLMKDDTAKAETLRKRAETMLETAKFHEKRAKDKRDWLVKHNLI